MNQHTDKKISVEVEFYRQGDHIVAHGIDACVGAQGADLEEAKKAFLTTVTAHVCIDIINHKEPLRSLGNPVKIREGNKVTDKLLLVVKIPRHLFEMRDSVFGAPAGSDSPGMPWDFEGSYWEKAASA